MASLKPARFISVILLWRCRFSYFYAFSSSLIRFQAATMNIRHFITPFLFVDMSHWSSYRRAFSRYFHQISSDISAFIENTPAFFDCISRRVIARQPLMHCRFLRWPQPYAIFTSGLYFCHARLNRLLFTPSLRFRFCHSRYFFDAAEYHESPPIDFASPPALPPPPFRVTRLCLCRRALRNSFAMARAERFASEFIAKPLRHCCGRRALCIFFRFRADDAAAGERLPLLLASAARRRLICRHYSSSSPDYHSITSSARFSFTISPNDYFGIRHFLAIDPSPS